MLPMHFSNIEGGSENITSCHHIIKLIMSPLYETQVIKYETDLIDFNKLRLTSCNRLLCQDPIGVREPSALIQDISGLGFPAVPHLRRKFLPS